MKVALGRYIWCSTFSKESLVFNVQQIHALLLVWSTVKGAKKRSSPHEIIQGDQLSNRKLFALLGPFIVVVALVIQNFASSFFPWVTWYARIDIELKERTVNWRLWFHSACNVEQYRLLWYNSSSSPPSFSMPLLLYCCTAMKRQVIPDQMLLDGHIFH